ncbi:MAG: tRNA (N6-threonylcarbamoyladenosine(37)-N6)-methyltransferase TrmO [Solidesulfovibrio sp.]|uniref:tRNA (N6-threonylcarbamoyladenosine(37)-N6)-methyltransferase TrmO n=1 Tax=Solidesulfovibrio sp. TaxID=2910990 RepID=UPI002B1F723F|nr:tRNA (N6-threonylcarbamoyladenosine(37)-N6)-methyltransferase TrmO [Solidesulfovibrio sp.]MEA4856439.1 tRNA (N6-threonylcarbamoyladenosine(37)-N6)-methyltransferase TrmO [Solidesulfovibrio sp.]
MKTLAEAPDIAYRPIGILRSPFRDIQGMPIQPVGAIGVAGRVEVHADFAGGLRDLEGFSHVFLLYHLHRVTGYDLVVRPFLDNADHGIFATRSPKRPNPIGLSVLELAGVDGTTVHLRNVDVLDGTPVLDIKPYVPHFDVWQAGRVGWFAAKAENAGTYVSDDRFR